VFVGKFFGREISCLSVRFQGNRINEAFIGEERGSLWGVLSSWKLPNGQVHKINIAISACTSKGSNYFLSTRINVNVF